MRPRYLLNSVLYIMMLFSVGLSCGGGSGSSCDPVAQTGCDSGQVCEPVIDGSTACFEPVTLRGTVIDPETGLPIEGARVVALDANNSAASLVVITDANGNYEIQVFSTRDADGNPISKITLRADADGYQTFPGGARPPFPIDLSAAIMDAEGFVLDGELTEIALVELPPGSPTGSISGTVEIPEDRTGVLIVAELTNGDPCPALPENDCTALAGEDGSYTIFNLPIGTYSVVALVNGYNYDPVVTNLLDGEDISVAALAINGNQTATLDGKVNIVNPGMGEATSVILVVKSTLIKVESALLPGVPVLIRGATPPGLRVADVTGNFTMEGIPEGDYVILAAFEDDFLVRDPDICIAGTQILEQTFASGETVDLSNNPFKITGSLDNISPDGNEIVGSNPTFTWEDDSSEDKYQLTVLDSFGNIVCDTEVPKESGTNPSVDYATECAGSDPLESGKFYQVHVFSVKDLGGQCTEDHAISSSEDLRGVFQIQ